MSERFPWVVCGRFIGTATGWDQADTFCMTVYDLVPDSRYKGPSGECINIDFERGRIESYHDDGSVKESADLIHAIANCEPEFA